MTLKQEIILTNYNKRKLLEGLVVNGVYCETIVELWMEWEWSEVVTVNDV